MKKYTVSFLLEVEDGHPKQWIPAALKQNLDGAESASNFKFELMVPDVREDDMPDFEEDVAETVDIPEPEMPEQEPQQESDEELEASMRQKLASLEESLQEDYEALQEAFTKMGSAVNEGLSSGFENEDEQPAEPMNIIYTITDDADTLWEDFETLEEARARFEVLRREIIDGTSQYHEIRLDKDDINYEDSGEVIDTFTASESVNEYRDFPIRKLPNPEHETERELEDNQADSNMDGEFPAFDPEDAAGPKEEYNRHIALVEYVRANYMPDFLEHLQANQLIDELADEETIDDYYITTYSGNDTAQDDSDESSAQEHAQMIEQITSILKSGGMNDVEIEEWLRENGEGFQPATEAVDMLDSEEDEYASVEQINAMPQEELNAFFVKAWNCPEADLYKANDSDNMFIYDHYMTHEYHAGPADKLADWYEEEILPNPDTYLTNNIWDEETFNLESALANLKQHIVNLREHGSDVVGDTWDGEVPQWYISQEVVGELFPFDIFKVLAECDTNAKTK